MKNTYRGGYYPPANKFLCLLVTIAMIAASLPIIVSAYTGTKYGDYLYYELNEDNTAVIITDCDKTATEIAIPEEIEDFPVTAIGEQAFISCSSLASISIPDNVTSIGSGAFYDTEYYNDTSNWENGVLYIGNHLIVADRNNINGEYTIKSGTKTIAGYSFANCRNLTKINIPDSVTDIGDHAFRYCSNLTGVTIPGGVTNIAIGAFQYCSSLVSINIPDRVTIIGDYAFYGCENLTSVTIPDNITSIGGGAFQYTKYFDNKSNWQNGALYIGNHLIWVVDGEITNTEYTIKDGTKTIADYAFELCKSVTNITIPNSVTSIGYRAFLECDRLTDVYYSGTETSWNKMKIGDNNDCLKNATIHYNSTGPSHIDDPTKPTPTPTPKPTPIPVTTAEIGRTDAETDTEYSFDVDAADKYENCYVYAAVYDADGVLLRVSRVPLDTEGNTIISASKSEGDALVKVFLWADTLQPIIEKAEEIPLI